MKENFQKKMEAAVAGFGEGKPSLLLQSCCGPCSSAVLEVLTQHFSVTLLYFNPNIRPAAEYEKRLSEQRRLLAESGLPVKLLECDYAPERFDEVAKGLWNEPEGGKRCTACFRLRLGETARRAAEGGFDWFCSTLSVSPHKNAELLNEIGEELTQQYGVRWLPNDFKKRGGYQRSLELSKDYNLYRQNYCGCTPRGETL